MKTELLIRLEETKRLYSDCLEGTANKDLVLLELWRLFPDLVQELEASNHKLETLMKHAKSLSEAAEAVSLSANIGTMNADIVNVDNLIEEYKNEG